MKNKLFFILISLVFTCPLFPVPCTLAEVPHLINYQGRLTDADNTPLNGSYNITFRIYDAETAGNLLWEENQSGVIINKGIFSILLGSVTNLNLSFDKPYFLEIKVGNEVMSPRQRITAAGYAISAENAEKIKASNTDTTPGTLEAKTKNSIVVDSNQLQLSGDVVSPGNDKVYGTDSNGVRGWYGKLSFGDWISKSNNTVYQADTDGFICALKGSIGSGFLTIYTDSSNPPATVRHSEYQTSDAGSQQSGMIPVRKGDYWKVTGATMVYWLSLGGE